MLLFLYEVVSIMENVDNIEDLKKALLSDDE